jgi:hypothetical protein
MPIYASSLAAMFLLNPKQLKRKKISHRSIIVYTINFIQFLVSSHLKWVHHNRHLKREHLNLGHYKHSYLLRVGPVYTACWRSSVSTVSTTTTHPVLWPFGLVAVCLRKTALPLSRIIENLFEEFFGFQILRGSCEGIDVNYVLALLQRMVVGSAAIFRAEMCRMVSCCVYRFIYIMKLKLDMV